VGAYPRLDEKGTEREKNWKQWPVDQKLQQGRSRTFVMAKLCSEEIAVSITCGRKQSEIDGRRGEMRSRCAPICGCRAAFFCKHDAPRLLHLKSITWSTLFSTLPWSILSGSAGGDGPLGRERSFGKFKEIQSGVWRLLASIIEGHCFLIRRRFQRLIDVKTE
jgi:hypothetical protein